MERYTLGLIRQHNFNDHFVRFPATEQKPGRLARQKMLDTKNQTA